MPFVIVYYVLVSALVAWLPFEIWRNERAMRRLLSPEDYSI